MFASGTHTSHLVTWSIVVIFCILVWFCIHPGVLSWQSGLYLEQEFCVHHTIIRIRTDSENLEEIMFILKRKLHVLVESPFTVFMCSVMCKQVLGLCRHTNPNVWSCSVVIETVNVTGRMTGGWIVTQTWLSTDSCLTMYRLCFCLEFTGIKVKRESIF